jgi:hypothetical protein
VGSVGQSPRRRRTTAAMASNAWALTANSGNRAETEAPSLSNGFAAGGGLTTADILRILFGW